MEKIGVIIVLYNRGVENLLSAEDSNLELIIVDNTPNRSLELKGNHIHYIPLLQNQGIAKAQNIGINKARELGCRYVVFFDQDSRINPHLIEGLHQEFLKIKTTGKKIGAIGPALVEIQTGEKYKGSSIGGIAKPVGSLISSGTFTEMSVLDEVGGFAEKMFIDLVDHEWSWRAQSKGYSLYQSASVILHHQVGKGSCRILGQPVLISAPIRYYYQYRNTIWLLKSSHAPKSWKYKVLMRRIAELFIVPFKTGQWFSTVRNIAKGIKAGLGGRL